MKTWSEVLEELRKQNNDDTEYDWIVPWDLLNARFAPDEADAQLAAMVPPQSDDEAQVVAWSERYVYFLDTSLADNQAISCVARNPPQ